MNPPFIGSLALLSSAPFLSGRVASSSGTSVKPFTQQAAKIPDILLDRLAARDDLIDSLLLRYESVVRLPADSAVCSDQELGWWYWRKDLDALVVLTGCKEETPQFERVIWNGSASHWIRMSSKWSNRTWLDAFPEEPPSLVQISPVRTVGPLTKLATPQYLGLFFAREPWSQFLRKASDVIVLDGRAFEGRPCFTFFADFDIKGGKGDYGSPWLLSIDDTHSLLVVRMDSFVDGSELTDSEQRDQLDSKKSIVINNKRWFRSTFLEIDKIDEIGEGVWIGTHSISGTDKGHGAYTEVNLNVSGSAVNQAPPEQLSTEVPHGTLIDDLFRGERYYSGHIDDNNYTLNRQLFDNLSMLNGEIAMQWRDAFALTEPLADANPSEGAAYVFLLLNNELKSFNMIRGALAPLHGPLPEGDGLWRAWRALQNAGLATTMHAFSGADTDVESMPLGKWVLLSKAAASPSQEVLQMANRVGLDSVLSFRPGFAPHRHSWAEWKRNTLSVKQVLLAAREHETIVAPTRQNSTALSRVIAGVIAVLSCLGLLLLLVRGRYTPRRQAKSSVVTSE